MVLPENYAATAAQVIPVLAFAAVVQFAAIFKHGPRLFRGEKLDASAWVAWLLALIIFVSFLFASVEAEMRCLDALAGHDVAPGSTAYIRATVKGGFVLLIVIPALSPVTRLASSLLARRRDRHT